jgi:hypothetical protein
MRMPSLFSVFVLALAAGSAVGQDMIDNAEFGYWSKYKKGTSTTIKITTVSGAIKSETVSTFTLLEVGADKLVIETTTVTKSNGKDFKIPAEKRDVPKKIAAPKGKTPDTKPPGTYEEGTETIKVGGIDVKTKWYKYKTDNNGLTTQAQSWSSDDVPGGFVRLVSKTTGKSKFEMTMELVEIKKP